MLKILKIITHKYRKFDVSGIDTLEIDFEKDAHAILGTNGCGKSSLLDLLLPKPHNKTLFDKHGFVELLVTDGVDTYRICYNPKSGHNFLKNTTEEMNGSNIQNIQNELIEKTFGLNNTVRDILKCNLDLVNMKPSQRKATLSSLCDIDIELFIEKHKSARKELTAIENQLKLLYDRSTRRLAKMLPEEAFQEMQKNHSTLVQRENRLVRIRADLDSKLRNLRKVSSPEIDSVERAKELFETNRLRVDDIINGNFGGKHIAVEDEIVQLPVVLENYRTNVKRLENQVMQLNIDIDEKEQNLASLSIDTSETRKTLEAYQEQLKELPTMSDWVREEQEERCINAIAEMSGICNKFVNIGSRILEQTEVNRIYSEVNGLSGRIRDIEGDLAIAQNKRDEVLDKFNIYSVPDGCPKESCGVYSQYSSYAESNQGKLDSLNSKIAQCEDELRVLKVKLHESSETYETQKLCSEVLSKASRVLTRTPILCTAVPAETVRETLNKGSFIIVEKLNAFVDQSRLYRKRLVIEKEIAKLQATIDKESSSKKVSKSHIEQNLKFDYNNREKFLALIEKYQKKIEDRTAKLHACQARVKKKTNMGMLSDKVKVLREFTARAVEEELLKKSLEVIETDISETSLAISKINATVREQEDSRHVLENEIYVSIKELEPKKEILVKVEKALKELQSKYIRNFLNNLIRIANGFLEEMVSYDVRLNEITSDHINFKFNVKIDEHVQIDDISECSDAQKQMIELCFTLALIVEKGLMNYPLFLDEIDRPLDSTHRQRVLEFLDKAVDKNIVSQLFIICHDSALVSGIVSDVTVLDDTNITLPEEYNTHSKITRTA